MSQLSAPPSNPAVAPPARRPGSVRRTSTVLMFWPDGMGTDLHLKGRARDLLTPADGGPSVVREADLYAVTGPERDIRRIEADPAPGALERLVGCRAGGNLRKAIATSQSPVPTVTTGTLRLPIFWCTKRAAWLHRSGAAASPIIALCRGTGH